MPCCTPATDWTYGSSKCGTCGETHLYCKECKGLIGHCASLRKRAESFIPMQRAGAEAPATVTT